jgi:lantibiotic modifying enzyme
VKRTAPPLFRTAWCHGAPGIALSRLCARDCFEDSAGRAELDAALEATARAIERDLESGTAVASLCHGITGNVEILTYACEVGGDRTERLSESVRRATAWVLAHAHGTLKPAETPAHPADPGLMLGAAGLGQFLLRVARPAIPSALWAGRETMS